MFPMKVSDYMGDFQKNDHQFPMKWMKNGQTGQPPYFQTKPNPIGVDLEVTTSLKAHAAPLISDAKWHTARFKGRSIHDF